MHNNTITNNQTNRIIRAYRNGYVSKKAKLTLRRLIFLDLINSGKGASQQHKALGLSRLTLTRYNTVLTCMGLITRTTTGRKPYILTEAGWDALNSWKTKMKNAELTLQNTSVQTPTQ